MDPETFGGMAYEFSEVARRLHSLLTFINAPDYFLLDDKQKELLQNQKMAMQAYTGTLLERIEYEIENV